MTSQGYILGLLCAKIQIIQQCKNLIFGVKNSNEDVFGDFSTMWTFSNNNNDMYRKILQKYIFGILRSLCNVMAFRYGLAKQ